MKKYLQLYLISLFFITNNPYAHAVIETHPQQVTPQYKPTFLQKVSLKIAEKRLKKYQKSPDNVRTKGDKLAKFAFKSALIIFGYMLVMLLLFAGSSFNLLNIFIFSLILNLPSFTVAIIALTRDDLSTKSKEMAKWAIAIDLLGPLLLVLITKKFL